MQACATGRHIAQAALTARTTGVNKPTEHVRLTFTDVFVDSCSLTGSSPDQLGPMTTFSFKFAKYDLEYRERKANGTTGAPMRAGYDFVAKKKR
jgi:type VI secretion system secreted protein Hcp